MRQLEINGNRCSWQERGWRIVNARRGLLLDVSLVEFSIDLTNTGECVYVCVYIRVWLCLADQAARWPLFNCISFYQCHRPNMKSLKLKCSLI